MKFRGNFAEDLEAQVLRIRILGMVLILGALILGAWFVGDGLRLSRQGPGMRERIAALELRLKAGLSGPSLVPSQVRDLNRRLSRYLNLGRGRGRSTIQILGRIEAVLPRAVKLSQFDHSLERGEIQVSAKSASLEGLSAFLQALEADKSFEKVLLSRQGRDASGFDCDLLLVEREAAP